jgi:hypothetical protein
VEIAGPFLFATGLQRRMSLADLRWIHNQRRYFQVDWDVIRVVIDVRETGVWVQSSGFAENRLLLPERLDLLRSLDDADPIRLNMGARGDTEQRDAVLGSLRADLAWVELTGFSSQNGKPSEYSVFVRLADIVQMQDQEARTFHGPGGNVELPAGLSIALKDTEPLADWVRAVGKSAERLREMASQDWQVRTYRGVVDPLT